jgi:hypothetical protein
MTGFTPRGPYFPVYDLTDGNWGATSGRRWVTAGGFYRLVYGYYGPLVRVRNGTTNEERDFTTAPYSYYLNWAAIRGWLGPDTGFVVTVYTQRGPFNSAMYPVLTAVNWTQSTTGNQPKLNFTDFSMDSGDSADGTHRSLACNITDLTQDYEAVGDLLRNGSLTTSCALSFGAANLRLGWSAADTIRYCAESAGVNAITGTATDADWHMFSVFGNGASSEVWADGVQIASGNAGTGAMAVANWLSAGTNATRAQARATFWLTSPDAIISGRRETMYRKYLRLRLGQR